VQDDVLSFATLQEIEQTYRIAKSKYPYKKGTKNLPIQERHDLKKRATELQKYIQRMHKYAEKEERRKQAERNNRFCKTQTVGESSPPPGKNQWPSRPYIGISGNNSPWLSRTCGRVTAPEEQLGVGLGLPQMSVDLSNDES